ncbi:MAG: pyruvate, water dikinase regulatory protein [Bdellovibrionota bacterium]
MRTSKSIIYIISDGTGETASLMTKAALVQYKGVDASLVRFKNVRAPDQVKSIIDEAIANQGFIVYTVVSQDLRTEIQKQAIAQNIPHVDLLGPLLGGLDNYFDIHKPMQAGILRAVDEKYFKRIDAIEFTVKHDDGKELRDLENAEIILVGISRTSKTPLSIFLSHKGWKVANVPLVVNVPPPKEIFEADQRKVIALTIDPDKLSLIRANRLSKLGDGNSDYASLQHVLDEIQFADELYKKNKKWPVFDVTSRALEETASEIIKIISKRFGVKEEIF